ncbi:major facilitator superfamily domain-containing protein [Stachybotrys elegans]|uniref:Major facilitator superfamily domain-containing protein n=1 Tax=Stachybotrys elegans TaxID=80388 RepID=A0A8K0SNF5_9HYPO|nr:major facilitator superfamily domain-containing protein [Stachybotrys elegans]
MGETRVFESNSVELVNVLSSNSSQDGVRGIEGISLTWTGWYLFASYCSIMLMAFTTSLEGQVNAALLPFVTSSFQGHSLVSTISVVRGVIDAVIKPPMAKLADVFGRLEAFSLSVGLFVLGYVQMAASNNVETFASAQIFYSAGFTGLLVLQQIFIADTSDLSYRALLSTLPDVPFLVTTWIGGRIGSEIMSSSGSWRWAYGMWAIILPVAFLPLFLSLFLNGWRAKRLGLAPQAYTTLRGGVFTVLRNLWWDLDLGGVILLSAGFALILIPCTIASTISGGWNNGRMVAMVTIGAILLVAFPLWEASTRWAHDRGMKGKSGMILSNLAPYPIVPLHLFKSRTFTAGIVLAMFYFMVFYLSVFPYFLSYLLVVRNLKLASATPILNIFSLSSTVSSLIVSALIKITNRYKWFVTAGSCLYMLGIGLMMRYRTQEASISAIIGTQILIGFGGGMLNVPAQLGVQASAGHQHVGTSTALFLTLTSVGGAIGSAISGAIWGRLIPSKLRRYLPEEVQDQAMVIYSDVGQALGYPVGSPERDAINLSYQETMTTLLTVALCMCVPVVLCSLLMGDFELVEMNQGVKGRVVGGEVDRNEQKKGDRRSLATKFKAWVKGRSKQTFT